MQDVLTKVFNSDLVITALRMAIIRKHVGMTSFYNVMSSLFGAVVGTTKSRLKKNMHGTEHCKFQLF
jgi:predicted membrane protein